MQKLTLDLETLAVSSFAMEDEVTAEMRPCTRYGSTCAYTF